MVTTNKTSRKLIVLAIAASLYVCNVNMNINHKARLIEEERRLATWLGGSECLLTPPTKITPDLNSTRTLLTSYPGSGKRFTYNVIEGLTDHVAGDDHNFSGNGDDVLHLKTGYPHNDGVWSWGSSMDQSILLIRNPRWALPAYHNMRFELDFSTNYAESYVRLPFVMTFRPDVETWDVWRDIHFEDELKNWIDHVTYWMEDGLLPDGTLDPHCSTDLDCKPKAIVDFDKFYQEHPSTEFYKISNVLDASNNVETINKEAQACILDAVYDKKALHAGNRDGNGTPPSYKKFSAEQLNQIVDSLTAMKDKYSSDVYAEDEVAQTLVAIIDEYITQDWAEYEFENETV